MVNAWQHSNIQEIAAGIHGKSLDPQLQMSFVQWICDERHPDVQRHLSELPKLQADWPQHRNALGFTRGPSLGVSVLRMSDQDVYGM